MATDTLFLDFRWQAFGVNSEMTGEQLYSCAIGHRHTAALFFSRLSDSRSHLRRFVGYFFLRWTLILVSESTHTHTYRSCNVCWYEEIDKENCVSDELVRCLCFWEKRKEKFAFFFGHSRCKSDLPAFKRNLDIKAADAARHEILDVELHRGCTQHYRLPCCHGTIYNT